MTRKTRNHLDRYLGRPMPAGSPKRRREAENGTRVATPHDAAPADASSGSGWVEVGIATAALLPIFLWAYRPTLVDLVNTWDREPDYSHGYFVFPLALFFLWERRDRFPGWTVGLRWLGLIPLAFSIVVRVVGARFFLNPADGWSILFWFAGVVWFLGGWKLARWAAPSIAFLVFMVPMPYRAEGWLSLPLQRIATQMSTWVLQCFGQPAIAEGNTIFLGQSHLEVEQACSGLRIFMGIIALAFAYIILFRRSWWEKALILLSIVPIALIANSTRIVVTGFLYQYASGEAAHKFTHDVSGWFMVPFAAGLFGLVLWYLGSLTRQVEPVDMRTVIHRQQIQAGQ